jgi:hypothetical protein
MSFERALLLLVNEGQFDILTRDLWHLLGEARHLRPALLVGRGDEQSQQMPVRVHRDVRLTALAPLRPVVAGTRATFRGRLQCSAVKDGGRRARRLV